MKAAAVAVLAVAAAAGCQHSTNPPSPAEICEQIVAKIRATKPPEMTKIVDKMLPAIRASCLEDAWPDDVKACFVAAPDSAALTTCDRMLPKSVQDKITHRQLPAN